MSAQRDHVVESVRRLASRVRTQGQLSIEVLVDRQALRANGIKLASELPTPRTAREEPKS